MKIALLVIAAVIALSNQLNFEGPCGDFSKVTGAHSKALLDASLTFRQTLDGTYYAALQAGAPPTSAQLTAVADAYAATCRTLCNVKSVRYPLEYEFPIGSYPKVLYTGAGCIPDDANCKVEGTNGYLEGFLIDHNITNLTTDVTYTSSGVTECPDDAGSPANKDCFDFNSELQRKIQKVNRDFLLCLGSSLLEGSNLTKAEGKVCTENNQPACLAIDGAKLMFIDNVDEFYNNNDIIQNDTEVGFCVISACEANANNGTNLKYQMGPNAGVLELLASNGASLPDWEVVFENRYVKEIEVPTTSSAASFMGSMVVLSVAFLVNKL